jgi:hypothetical protein
MTSQGTHVASNVAELARSRKSRVTSNKVEKAKLFEWCTAHEVWRTTGRARMRAVTEVVSSARFHLVMDRENDKYFSIGTEYRTTVIQSLTSGNAENLLKNCSKPTSWACSCRRTIMETNIRVGVKVWRRILPRANCSWTRRHLFTISQLSLETLTVSRRRVRRLKQRRWRKQQSARGVRSSKTF